MAERTELVRFRCTKEEREQYEAAAHGDLSHWIRTALRVAVEWDNAHPGGNLPEFRETAMVPTYPRPHLRDAGLRSLAKSDVTPRPKKTK